MEILFRASHSHLYAGARGVVEGDVGAAPDGAPADYAPADCRVEFSDGGMAMAALSRVDPARWRLAVGPYRTAAGTDVPARAWVVSFDATAEGRSFRVHAKATAPGAE